MNYHFDDVQYRSQVSKFFATMSMNFIKQINPS